MEKGLDLLVQLMKNGAKTKVQLFQFFMCETKYITTEFGLLQTQDMSP